MIKMGKVLKDDVENPHSRHRGIKSRMGRLLTRYHSKFKFMETAHLMHKDNKADLATLIDQYRQAMELLQAITEKGNTITSKGGEEWIKNYRKYIQNLLSSLLK